MLKCGNKCFCRTPLLSTADVVPLSAMIGGCRGLSLDHVACTTSLVRGGQPDRTRNVEVGLGAALLGQILLDPAGLQLGHQIEDPLGA